MRRDPVAKKAEYFEFAVDQVDWEGLTKIEAELGLSELVERGFLVETKRGTYRTKSPYGEWLRRSKSTSSRL